MQACARREVYRQVGNIVLEARQYSGLAIDTLVAIAKDGQTDSCRLNAAVELLNRGYGRPAQSLKPKSSEAFINTPVLVCWRPDFPRCILWLQ